MQVRRGAVAQTGPRFSGAQIAAHPPGWNGRLHSALLLLPSVPVVDEDTLLMPPGCHRLVASRRHAAQPDGESGDHNHAQIAPGLSLTAPCRHHQWQADHWRGDGEEDDGLIQGRAVDQSCGDHLVTDLTQGSLYHPRDR